MAEKEDIKWGLAKRFEFIEWRSFWVGRVNRSDLEDRFGVSTPQASLDLRAYQDAAAGNIDYDSSEKAYLPLQSFKPEFARLSADRYLIQLDAILNGAVAAADTWFGSPPPAAVMPAIARSIAPEMLRTILRAIENRQEIDIDYQSLSSSRVRAIAPHSLAYDGHRWHARAWCPKHSEFRDFVLSRIRSVGESRPSAADPTNDVEWNTLLELKIIAHPGLDEAQRAAIELDYGMKDGVLIVTTRAALSFYVIKQLLLDLDDDKVEPLRKQICLTNSTEIDAIREDAKAKMRERVRRTP